MVDTTFTREVTLPVPVEEAFAWHERPGALDRLIPPWEPVRIESYSGGVNDGARVVLCNRLGPFRVRWIAEHFDYEKNRQFRDLQVSGPFKRWEHLHSFRPTGAGASVMKDHIQYRIPAGPFGQFFAKSFVRDKIDKMFAYRHETTTADLKAHARYKEKGTMHIAITGSHGLVGSELVPFLTTGGHQITRIVRGTAGAGEIAWNPGESPFEAAGLDGIDAVVHLAGENIASRRWGAAQKKRIHDSRVNGTRLLCEGLARLKAPPKVLISASAIGYYGNRGDELLDESSPAGHGFLAEVAEAWEAAAEPAVAAGIRVANLRFGVILSPKEGGLAKMLTPFKLGGGGIVGNGRQSWSWVSIDDAVEAILHVIMTDSLSGPINTVTPNAVTNREFTKTLGRVLSRPTIVPMPAAAARLALGEMANELLLASARVEPKRLIESGYEFRHAELEPALRHLLGRQSCTGGDSVAKWMKIVLILAGIYNLAWGAWTVLSPAALFRWAGMELPRYPQIWQCAGMIVGVYGLGYLIAAGNPLRHWPIVLVGLVGKIFGPIGFVAAALSEELPWSWGATIVTNDLIWWIPFAMILYQAFRFHTNAATDSASLESQQGITPFQSQRQVS